MAGAMGFSLLIKDLLRGIGYRSANSIRVLPPSSRNRPLQVPDTTGADRAAGHGREQFFLGQCSGDKPLATYGPRRLATAQRYSGRFHYSLKTRTLHRHAVLLSRFLSAIAQPLRMAFSVAIVAPVLGHLIGVRAPRREDESISLNLGYPSLAFRIDFDAREGAA
jgi:hypothetical protein